MKFAATRRVDDSGDGLAARTAMAHRKMRKEQHEAVYLVLAEVVFILLPFLIIGMLLWNRGRFLDLFSQPEWAMAASVIMGQALVKVISGFLSTPTPGLAWQKVSFFVAAVIVFLLAPSFLVVSLVVNAERTSGALVWLQVGMFVFGLVMFFLGGWGSESIRAWAKFQENTARARKDDPQQESGARKVREGADARTSGNGNEFTQSDWNRFVKEKAEKATSDSGSLPANAHNP